MTLYLLGLLTVAAAPAAYAAEVADLYTVRVPVDVTARDWREAAYRRALGEVLIRMTGQRTASTDPALDALFEDPAGLVQGYRQDDDALWVSFDGRAIGSRLQQAGRAVWGSDRPVTLLWLAVDSGGGRRDLVAADDGRGGDGLHASLRRRVATVAQARGLPIVWPLLDAEERSAVAFSDVWGGFEEPVLAASSRYAANSVLLGRVDTRDRQLPRWTWYFGGEQRQWRATVEDTVDRVADLMAGQLAAVGDEQTIAVRLTVTGVHDLQGYADVGRYLRSLSVVRDLQLEQLADGALTYRLELLGSSDRLGRVLGLSGRFGPMEPGVSSEPATMELTVAYTR